MAPGPDDEPRDEDLGEGATETDRGDEPVATGDLGDHAALPPRLEAWRKRSATGAILTGLARGLQQVFEKEPEQPAIIMTTSGDPPKDLPVDADVEQGRPRQSVVNIRPWLLHKPETQTPPDDPGNDQNPASRRDAGNSGEDA